MVGMRQKLKDVELSPYMLAIYKDNEHNHLLKHALECWKLRTQNGRPAPPGPLATNPILYCRHPSIEMLEEYRIGTPHMLGSRILECPKVARWALERVIDIHLNDLIFLREKIKDQSPYYPRVLSLIQYDEDLIYKVIYAGIGDIMPDAFHNQLTSDQKLAITFCS